MTEEKVEESTQDLDALSVQTKLSSHVSHVPMEELGKENANDITQIIAERIQFAREKYVDKKKCIPSFELKSMGLSEIPNDMASLGEKLKKLNLRDNKFTTLSTIPTALSVQQSSTFWGQIKELNLGSNLLGPEIPKELYIVCQRLEKLNLQNNKIKSIPSEFCKNLKKLRILQLDDNVLEEIPPSISEMTSLIGLHLHNNRLTCLPATFSKLTNLEALSLSMNPLDHCLLDVLFPITPNDEDQDQNFDYPNSTSIVSTETNVEELIKQLEYLDCRRTAAFKKLQALILWGCKIYHMPACIDQCSKLEVLNLGHCELRRFPTQSLSKLKKMKDFRVNDNHLSQNLIDLNLSLLTDLQKLDIRRNPSIFIKPDYLETGKYKQVFPKMKQLRHSFADHVIHEKLYISDVIGALNLQHLKHLKITHVINCCSENCDGLDMKLLHDDLAYMKFKAIDKPWYDMSQHFEEGCKFIHDALMNQDHRVLVHCMAGKSRSAAIIIAYLLKYKHFKCFEEAHTFLNETRSCGISVNEGFISQLKQFECTIADQSATK